MGNVKQQFVLIVLGARSQRSKCLESCPPFGGSKRESLELLVSVASRQSSAGARVTHPAPATSVCMCMCVCSLYLSLNDTWADK